MAICLCVNISFAIFLISIFKLELNAKKYEMNRQKEEFEKNIEIRIINEMREQKVKEKTFKFLIYLKRMIDNLNLTFKNEEIKYLKKQIELYKI